MQISISQIKTNVLIGCQAIEHNTKQPLIIDVVLDLELSSFIDEIESTINYSLVDEYIKFLAENSKFKLLESLAKYLVDKLLARFELIKRIKISLTKPEINTKKNAEIKLNFEFARQYQVGIALGSNLGNSKAQIIAAGEMLTEFLSEIKLAPIYQSRPACYANQATFYNSVLIASTKLSPVQLLAKLKQLEYLMGGAKSFENGPRLIDLDIIFYEDLNFIHGFLQIPHKEMHQRDFVLKPLSDIAPNWIHPLFKLSVTELLNNLTERFIIVT